MVRTFIANTAYEALRDYVFAVIPLFVLMGLFAAHSGISQAAYRSARAWLGPIRGGLALATLLSRKRENRPDAIAAHAALLKIAPERVESLRWLAHSL